MAYFNEAERARIARAVSAAQGRTRGEIAAVIAREAGDYRFIPLLWASGLAFALPLPLIAIGAVLPDLGLSALLIFEAQILAFLCLALLFFWPPVKMRLIPRSLKRARAGHLARVQFLEQGLHHAEQHSGVMIFVSMAERYIEIVADEGINDRVPPETWQEIVSAFIQDIRAERMTEAFESAIDSCGALLAQHYPAPATVPARGQAAVGKALIEL